MNYNGEVVVGRSPAEVELDKAVKYDEMAKFYRLNARALRMSAEEARSAIERYERLRDGALALSAKYAAQYGDVRGMDGYGAKDPSQGNWYPASGGTETPFVTRTGKRLLYVWQPSTGQHAYLDLDTDLILSDEDAAYALALNGYDAVDPGGPDESLELPDVRVRFHDRSHLVAGAPSRYGTVNALVAFEYRDGRLHIVGNFAQDDTFYVFTTRYLGSTVSSIPVFNGRSATAEVAVYAEGERPNYQIVTVALSAPQFAQLQNWLGA